MFTSPSSVLTVSVDLSGLGMVRAFGHLHEVGLPALCGFLLSEHP